MSFGTIDIIKVILRYSTNMSLGTIDIIKVILWYFKNKSFATIDIINFWASDLVHPFHNNLALIIVLNYSGDFTTK